jgi:hypothetical protein
VISSLSAQTTEEKKMAQRIRLPEITEVLRYRGPLDDEQRQYQIFNQSLHVPAFSSEYKWSAISFL